jgi:hypothetical protein
MSTVIGDLPIGSAEPVGETSPSASCPSPHRSLLANPHFCLLLIVQILFWSSSAIFLMLPKFLALQLHADALWIGLIMGSMGVGSVAMAPLIAGL